MKDGGSAAFGSACLPSLMLCLYNCKQKILPEILSEMIHDLHYSEETEPGSAGPGTS